MPRIDLDRLIVSKGVSKPLNDKLNAPWIKVDYSIEMKFSSDSSDEDLQKAKIHAEKTIDAWLGEEPLPVTKPMPTGFDPNLLMKHGWKGRKQTDGTYAKGSTSFGWDFQDQFSKEVIDVLEAHGNKMQIDQYEFELTGNIVQARKKK